MSTVRNRRWPTLAAVAAVVLCVGRTGVADPGNAATRSISSPIVFVQLPAGQDIERQPPHAGGMLRADYGDGGRIVRLEPDGQLQVLTEGFDSACEFDVSFDAKRILFTGKRGPDDLWNVWEMNADGSEPRQITRDFGNCRSPAYQATLYTIVSTEPWLQIMFVSDAAGTMNEYGSGPATSLYSCKLDGTATRRLTMNLSDDMDPFLMPDGRVLLASWQRMGLGRGPLGRVALFGVNTDGADYALFCGDQGERVKHMPTVTTDGLVVFVEAPSVPWDGAGQLASVTLRRNLYSHRRITDSADRVFHSPSPLSDGDVLVSSRFAAAGSTHGIFRLDPQTGRPGFVFDGPEHHDIYAKVLAPRPQPDGRSSVVNEEYATGKLYCLDAYLTEPGKLRHMKRGMIKSLRVIEGVPEPFAPERVGLSSGRAVSRGIVKKRLLGVVPVEDDGSFHIEVPADTPIQLQTLDADGLALGSCGWIWAKHREPRGCIGCHEDPELTPENRFVDAMGRPGMKLTLPPEKRRFVDFRRDVEPIITKKCASCHVVPGLGARDALGETESDDRAGSRGGVLSANAIRRGEARTSPLIWRILGRNTSRPWDDTHHPGERLPKCPPPGAEQLTGDEKLTLIEWIDLGAPWDRSSDLSDPSEAPTSDSNSDGEK